MRAGMAKPKTFAASALGKNEGVDTHDVAVHIDQRASAVAGVDGRIGLNVGERLGGIGLARDARSPHPW